MVPDQSNNPFILMLRCIAIDDEPLALDLLEDNIRKVPFLELVASCDDPVKALQLVQENKPDLVFVDIQMPGITGLQFIQNAPRECMFILITAYEKYALEGYNLNVVDYLLKPVEFDRFLRACSKAQELFRLRKQDPAVQEPLPDYFFVNVEYSLLKIMNADIQWIESIKDYLKIYLQSSTTPVITRKSIRSMEQQLPSKDFIRIHKSYLISVNAITAVKKNSVVLGTTELPIGDSYREQFFSSVLKQHK